MTLAGWLVNNAPRSRTNPTTACRQTFVISTFSRGTIYSLGRREEYAAGEGRSRRALRAATATTKYVRVRNNMREARTIVVGRYCCRGTTRHERKRRTPTRKGLPTCSYRRRGPKVRDVRVSARHIRTGGVCFIITPLLETNCRKYIVSERGAVRSIHGRLITTYAGRPLIRENVSR